MIKVPAGEARQGLPVSSGRSPRDSKFGASQGLVVRALAIAFPTKPEVAGGAPDVCGETAQERP